MIGLSGLPDGGHQLEHPNGPLYVTVRKRQIVRAEIAWWGNPRLQAWGAVEWPRWAPRARPPWAKLAKGVMAGL